MAISPRSLSARASASKRARLSAASVPPVAAPARMCIMKSGLPQSCAIRRNTSRPAARSGNERLFYIGNGFGGFAADRLGKRGRHEGIQIAVQHGLRCTALDTRAQILDELIGLQHIGSNLVTPADVGLLADQRGRFGLLLLKFNFVQP